MEPLTARSRNLRVAVVAGVVALGLAALLAGTSEARAAWSTAEAALEPGEKLKVEPMVATCLWWSGAATAAVALFAALTSFACARRGWVGWVGPGEPGGLLPRCPPPARSFWFGLVAIVLLGLALRLPRMDLSLYNDEAHNYVRLIAGEWKNHGEKDGRFRQPRWAETAFRNSTGNNGFLYSILGRACHDTWKKITGAPDGAVKEWPLRVPPLLAGLATIALAGLTGARLGIPVAGLAMAALFAIHPWHVRYSTEARGYGIMILAVMAGYFFLVAALQSGRWRWWVAHGLCQWIALWANPGSLIAVAIGQGGVALMLMGWWWVRGRSEAAHHAARWAGGGLVAVLLAAFALAPGMIQLREQLQNNPSMVGTIPEAWWRDTLFFLGNGCGWGLANWGNPVNPGSVDSPLRVAGALAFYGLVFAGMGSAWRRGAATRVVLVLAALHFFSLVPFYLRSVLSANVLLWWYALPALPGLVVLAGLGLGTAAGRARWFTGSAALVFCLSALLTLPVFWEHGKSDGRGLVRLARGGDFPDYDASVITLDLWSDAVTYDPHARWADSLGQIAEAGTRADAEGKPFFLYVGHEAKARITHPEIVDYLHHSGRFELVHTAWALESPVHDNRLYRWKPPAGTPRK